MPDCCTENRETLSELAVFLTTHTLDCMHTNIPTNIHTHTYIKPQLPKAKILIIKACSSVTHFLENCSSEDDFYTQSNHPSNMVCQISHG